MKTIREILETLSDDSFYEGLEIDSNEDYADDAWEPDVDQDLKEIEEVLLASLPKEQNIDQPQPLELAYQYVGYNKALADTRKAIKELMK